MLGIYRVSQKNRSLVLKGLWLKFGKSSGSPQFDLFFEHKKSRIMRSKHLWEYCLEEAYPTTNLDNIVSQIFTAIFSGTPCTINMLMWGEGVDWATRPCGICYLQRSNLFKSQRYYWGGGREYDKLWDILIFVTQSTSILTFKLESSCLMCHKTFTNLPTFCRRLTGEQSFWRIFLVNLIKTKTKFQGNANEYMGNNFQDFEESFCHSSP